MKTITKIDTAKFKVIETEKPEAELMLDFAKVIDEFELDGDFYLIHWQARPKGLENGVSIRLKPIPIPQPNISRLVTVAGLHFS